MDGRSCTVLVNSVGSERTRWEDSQVTEERAFLLAKARKLIELQDMRDYYD